MVMTTLLLASILVLSTAVPVPQTSFPPPPADTQFYYLKAQTLPGSPHPEFDGLYVESYHTGAGLSDVTLNTSATSPQGFLNGTVQQFNLSSEENGYVPWSMLVTDDNYASFSPIEINAGYGAGFGAFYFNQTASGSLWWNSAGNSTDPYYDISLNEFGGWLACNWVHQNLPQLFWIDTPFLGDEPFPSNCAEIYLIPENA